MDAMLLKNTLKTFCHENVQLKLLAEDDLPFTLHWRNEFREWFNTTDKVLLADHLQWYKNYLFKNNDFVFIVQDFQGNRIGQAAVYNINWQEKHGEFGRFLVNPDFSGQGYMGQSVQALLKLCEEKLQLRSLYLEVKPHNARAIHIYKKAGFTEEPSIEGQNLKLSCIF